MAAMAALVAAAATGKEEIERYAAAAAAEMEERLEARFRKAPVVEVEEPEVLQGYEHDIMRICPPCPFGTGKTCALYCKGHPPPRVQGHVLCKNWQLCGLLWEEFKRKNSHVSTSPDMAETLTGLLKTARG